MTPTAKHNLSLVRHLGAYAVAGGAALALAPAAHASVIYTSTNIQVTQTGVGQQTQDFDLNHDGTMDVELIAAVSNDPGLYSYVDALGMNGGFVAVTASNQFLAQAFSSGDQIGNSVNWKANASVNLGVSPGSGSAQWPNNLADTEYLGVRFTANSQTYYGWVAVAVDDSVSNISTFQVTGYAYDNSGAAIAAGDTGTPEPSSMALFALGAVGIAALQRRRKRAKA